MRNFLKYFGYLLVFTSSSALADDLLVFSASWCGPCKSLKSALVQHKEKLTHFSIRVIDVDEDQETPKKYDVKRLPTIVRVDNAGKISRKVGFRSSADLLAWLGVK